MLNITLSNDYLTKNTKGIICLKIFKFHSWVNPFCSLMILHYFFLKYRYIPSFLKPSAFVYSKKLFYNFPKSGAFPGLHQTHMGVPPNHLIYKIAIFFQKFLKTQIIMRNNCFHVLLFSKSTG